MIYHKIVLFKRCTHAQSLSHVWLFVAPWTAAFQALLSVGFSRQEYWSGFPFPLPRDLPNPGTEPTSPAPAGRFFTTTPPGMPIYKQYSVYYSYYTDTTGSLGDVYVGSVGLSCRSPAPTPPYPHGVTWPRRGSSPHVGRRSASAKRQDWGEAGEFPPLPPI